MIVLILFWIVVVLVLHWAYTVWCIFRWFGTWACWSSPTLRKRPPSNALKTLGRFSRQRTDREGEIIIDFKASLSKKICLEGSKATCETGWRASAICWTRANSFVLRRTIMDPRCFFCSYEKFLIVSRAVRIWFTSNGKNIRMKVVQKGTLCYGWIGSYLYLVAQLIMWRNRLCHWQYQQKKLK